MTVCTLCLLRNEVQHVSESLVSLHKFLSLSSCKNVTLHLTSILELCKVKVIRIEITSIIVYLRDTHRRMHFWFTLAFVKGKNRWIRNVGSKRNIFPSKFITWHTTWMKQRAHREQARAAQTGLRTSRSPPHHSFLLGPCIRLTPKARSYSVASVLAKWSVLSRRDRSPNEPILIQVNVTTICERVSRHPRTNRVDQALSLLLFYSVNNPV